MTTSRREFLKTTAIATAAATATTTPALRADEAKAAQPFALNYIVSSCMYGKMKLAEILPEAPKTGASDIDIWCLVHGDQREQIEAMGHDAFSALLKKHQISASVFTRYPLGPFGLQNEMRAVKKFGCKVIVCGTKGPREPAGAEAKAAVKTFLEKMKPHVAAAEEHGITIAVENHDRQLLYTPDSLRYFADMNKSPHLGVAFAPHHLYKNVAAMPGLIEHLGPSLAFFYAQEHGKGSRVKLPKKQELMQMPGFGGGLDYRPLVAALRKINYQGFTEIFMHPVPRGIPILPTAQEITAAINKSRAYLEQCLEA